MKKKIVTLLATVMVIGLIGGCGKQSENQTENQTETIKENVENTDNTEELNQAKVLRIGDQSNYYTVKVAVEKGFFEEEFGDEVKVELSTFASGPAITEALVADQLDIGIYAELPAIQAKANHVDIKLISTFFESDEAYWLIAGKDSGIVNLEDIKGKTIAVRVGTSGHKLIYKYLDSLGLTENDVVFTNLNASESATALIAGDIDAYLASASNGEDALEQTGGVLVTTSKGYDTTVVFNVADNEYATANPDIVSRYLKVLDETNEWIRENQEEATQIVSQAIGAEQQVVEAYWNTFIHVITWDKKYEAILADTIDYLYEQGTIVEKPSVSELVDTSYLENAGLYK